MSWMSGNCTFRSDCKQFDFASTATISCIEKLRNILRKELKAKTGLTQKFNVTNSKSESVTTLILKLKKHNVVQFSGISAKKYNNFFKVCK